MFEGDGLPALICQQCCHEVDRSYKFKMKCETSDATLKQYIKKSPENSEDEGVAEVIEYLYWCLLFIFSSCNKYKYILYLHEYYIF
jgi:hypothetical protein